MLSKWEAEDVEEGAETASVAVPVAVLAAVRLELSLLELELALRSLSCCGGGGGGGGEVGDDDDFGFERLVFRHPPPTGTLRRTPPLVQ